ncbi:MAG: trimeric intracellular cation channel family protein [Deltaproteobacteria bacterium]|nr:trimeric intracellular cation channel family protein [Deltaproteobacteria bacterium]
MSLIYILDIFGTLAFAVSGAFRAVKYELDIFGVLVLSAATGVGGGIMRDTIIGSIPPAAFHDETYLLICIGGGLVVFVAAPYLAQRWDLVMIADAVGLGVFSAIGAAKGAAHGLGPIGAIFMGTLTATGGGVIRDILVTEIPAIIRKDFYATAAIAGAVSLVIFRFLGFGESVQVISAIIVATGLRIFAMTVNLNLPKIKSLPDSPSNITRTRKEKHKSKR